MKQLSNADGEGPIRNVELDAFEIEEMEVSNLQFEAFVNATGTFLPFGILPLLRFFSQQW